MYVLERGLNARWLGVVFAALTAVAAFGIGNMVQANSIAALVERDVRRLALDRPASCMTVLTAVVILGGITSIARVCEWLVPFMAIFYVLGCLVLLVMHAATIPATIGLIVTSAFTGQAAVGGFLGAGVQEAMRYGIARGLFSNESGLGSAPIVAAAAQTKNPVRQALVSSTGTFWDTVVVCAMTGLVRGQLRRVAAGARAARRSPTRPSPTSGVVGPLVLAVGLLTFVFSTILGWSYYGEKAAEYLFGTRAIVPYRWLWVAAVMVGSVVDAARPSGPSPTSPTA